MTALLRKVRLLLQNSVHTVTTLGISVTVAFLFLVTVCTPQNQSNLMFSVFSHARSKYLSIHHLNRTAGADGMAVG
jgi:hypothetical protein